jgi:hypothetical protein
VYEKNLVKKEHKKLLSASKIKSFVIDWLRKYYDKTNKRIAFLRMQGTDMQNNRGIFFTNAPSPNDIKKSLTADISKNNLIPMCIYLAIRHVLPVHWLNNRDQFLYPNESWESDKEFQNNCLAFALFHGQNKISCKQGTNHFIPFSEAEVKSRGKFDSDFMYKFIKGKLKIEQKGDLIQQETVKYSENLTFSHEAKAVFEAGLALFRYYHAQNDVDVNASPYDIREYFQGRSVSGKMHNKSEDEKYAELLDNLRRSLKKLAQKIEPKVYEHGFLK